MSARLRTVLNRPLLRRARVGTAATSLASLVAFFVPFFLLSEELSWKRELLELTQDALDDGSVTEAKLPGAYGTLGNAARGIGICELLTEGDTSDRHFRVAAEYCAREIRGLDRRDDGVQPGSYADRPLRCQDALYTAVLSGDGDILEAIAELTLETTDSLPERHPGFAPVYHHITSLALYVVGSENRAREELDNIRPTVETHEEMVDLYQGWRTSLRGLLDDDEAELSEGISRLLRDHHERKGDDPEYADEFVSLDASAYLSIGSRASLEISLESFDPELRDYLLVPPRA